MHVKRQWFIPASILLACVAVAASAVGYLRWSAGRVAAALADARAAEEAGDAVEALECYDLYVELAGEAADPQVLASRARVAMGMAPGVGGSPKAVGRAVEAAETAVRARPEDMRLRRQLAEMLLTHQDFAGARDHLLTIRDAAGSAGAAEDPAEIALLLARTWLGMGDYRQALSIVADLTGFSIDSRSFPAKKPDGPPSTAAYVLLAEIMRTRLGDDEAADRVVERCATVHPDDPEILVPFAWLMLKRKEPLAAIEAANRARNASPGDPATLVVRATALTAAGDLSAASDAYAEAVQTCPDDDFIFSAATSHLARYGTAEQASALLDVAWRHLPRQESTVLTFLTLMPIDAGALPEVSRHLENMVVENRADAPEAILLGARIHEARGQWTAAEKLLPKARAIAPAVMKPWFDDMLARCSMNLGEPAEALGVYERLESHPFFGWKSLLGNAEARLKLDQPDAAAEAIRKLVSVYGKWVIPQQVELATLLEAVIPSASTMIRVTAAQPHEKRDWRPIDTIMTHIAGHRSKASNGRIAILEAELLAARGDLDAALAVMPVDDPGGASTAGDSLRLRLIAERDGRDAMRAALDALSPERRDRGQVLLVAAGAEARYASGDDRGWLESLAAAAERIADPDEAAGTLLELAAMARRAGWYDASRNMSSLAARILPGDFRGPMGIVLEAASTGDAAAAAAAAEQVAAMEGAKTARSRVAAAAAIVAAVRSAGDKSAGSSSGAGNAMRERLDEARRLLVEADSDRKRWQPIPVLLADVEALTGNNLAAITQLRRAVDDGPHDSDVVLRLADALERLRCQADADRLRDGVAPSMLGGGDRLAIESLLERGDFPAAADRALAVIDPDTTDANTRAWLSRLCIRADRFDPAIAVSTRATELEPANPESWAALADCLMVAGRNEDALETLAAGREAVPAEKRTLLAARAAAIVGRDADAERMFRDLVGQKRGDIAAASMLVEFLVARGRMEDAKRFLRESIDVGSGYHAELKSWAKARLAWLEAGSTDARRGTAT